MGENDHQKDMPEEPRAEVPGPGPAQEPRKGRSGSIR